MFRLSDATRRQITMGLFLLLCVIPSVVVIGVGVWRSLPGRVAAEERRLTLLLGQPVEIDGVRHLRPGAAFYEGLEIRDPESAEVLVCCDQVRAELGAFRPKGAKREHPQLRLSAGEVTITASSAESFRALANRLLQRRIDGAPVYTCLVAKQLIFKHRESEFPAEQLEAWATLHATKSVIDVKLRASGLETKEPISMSLVRNREYEPPVDGFMIATKDGVLPCSIMETILPFFPDVGQEAVFQGSIVADHVPGGCQLKGQAIGWTGWRLRVKGDLQDIDLRKLAGRHIPHEISGLGKLHLEDLAFREGRLQSMIGELKARDGSISRALVNSCVTELGLKTNHPIAGYASLPYLELAVGFQLDGRGLAICGMCDADPPGALLLGTYTERLEAPTPTFGWITPAKVVAAVTGMPGEDPLTVSPYAASLLQRMPFIPTAASATIAAPVRSSERALRH